jgi:branched-chain amino acid transport system permease protein
MITLLSHVIVGAMVGLLYALIAMGFVIIYRSGKMVNMAQGEIVMLGAFLIWSFARFFGLPLWLSLGSAFAVSLLLGLLVNRLIIKSLIGEELLALVMATIGLMIFIRGLVLVIWNPMIHYFPVIFPMAGLKIGPYMLDRGLVFGGGITILLAGAVSWFFNHTRMGLEMTAVAEDHQIALSLGLNVNRSIAIAWAVSGVLCTLAAVIFLNGKGMTYLVGDIGLIALPVALFAGMESVGGLVLAGIIVGVSTGAAEYFLDPVFRGGVSSVFPFVIMVVVLFIRPAGLFGWKTIERI